MGLEAASAGEEGKVPGEALQGFSGTPYQGSCPDAAGGCTYAYKPWLGGARQKITPSERMTQLSLHCEIPQIPFPGDFSSSFVASSLSPAWCAGAVGREGDVVLG